MSDNGNGVDPSDLPTVATPVSPPHDGRVDLPPGMPPAPTPPPGLASTPDLPTVATPTAPPPAGEPDLPPGMAPPADLPPGVSLPPGIAGPGVLPGNGGDFSSDLSFLHRKPGDRMRHVSLEARSSRLPAWLSVPSAIVALVLFGMALSLATSNGWSGFKVGNSSSVRLRSGLSRQCDHDYRQLQVAEGLFLIAENRLPSSQQELVDGRYMAESVPGFTIEGDGSIATDGTPRCLTRTDTTTRLVIPAPLISFIGLGMLAAMTTLILNMWWIRRTFRSLPGGIRTVGSSWVLAPLVGVVALAAWTALVNHILVQPDEIDRMPLFVMLGVGSAVIWLAFSASIVRLGSMLTDIGSQFAKISWPGRMLRGTGLWMAAGIPFWAVAAGAGMLAENDNLSPTVGIGVLVVWGGGLALFGLADLLAVPYLALRATQGQDRMLLEAEAMEMRSVEQERQEPAQPPAADLVGTGLRRDPRAESEVPPEPPAASVGASSPPVA